MDTGKHSSVIVISVVSLCLMVNLFFLNLLNAEDDKPEFSLPEITILGKDISHTPLWGEKTKLKFMEEEITKGVSEEKEEKDFVTVIKSGIGRYDSRYVNLLHAGRVKDLRYYSQLDFYSTTGWREHSDETTYRPEVLVSAPIFENSELSLETRFLGKDLELPGPVIAPTPNADRRIDGIFFSIKDLIEPGHKASTSLGFYLDYGKVDEDPGRQDYENWVHGIQLTFENETTDGTENEFNIEVSRHEMVDMYQFMVGSIQGLKRGIPLSENMTAYFGGRIDSQEGVETSFGPIVGLDLTSGEKTTWRLGLSRNFEVARFSKLYLEDYFVEPNPSVLRPERSWLLGLDMEHHFNQWFSGGFSLFRKNSKDILVWDDTDNNGLLTPVNVRESYINGFKAEMRYYWTQRLGQHIGYLYQDINSEDDDFNVLPYYPKEKIDLGFFYQMNRFLRWDISGEYFGKQHVDKNEPGAFIPEYFIVSAEATYSYTNDRAVFLRIENLLNEGFEMREGYPGPERNIILGAKIKF